MNAGWIGSLGEALSVLLDHRGKTPKKLETDWAEDGVRVLSALHVKGGRVRSEPQRYVPKAIYDRWMPVKLEAGDILLTSEAPLGEVAFLPDRVEACLGQRLFGLRPNPDILDARYLYYLLHHSSIRSQLLQRSSGTTVAGIRQAELIQVRLDLPPMPTQRAVSSALGAFDDLIENNRRRIEILEEMARLLYREWFVHFRFPGHEDVGLVDSELGPIPEGWEIGVYSDIVDESKRTVDAVEIPVGSPLIGLEHLPRRSTTIVEWDSAEDVGSRRKSFNRGEILFGKIRPYFHKVADAPVDGYSSTDAIVFVPRQSVAASRALAVASSDEFVGVAVATSNGTKMPRANTDILLNYELVHPSDEVEEAFASTIDPISELRQNLAQQNRVLREARDLLLPRLVSGELDVSELDLGEVLG